MKNEQITKIQRFFKSLGPGILFAGAAIGGSHLIQSTRAGANYGYKLLLLILVINILKYPFFEFGQRFTAVTQKNLLMGYNSLGRWVLYLYLILTLITALPTVAAVSFINANIATYMIGVTISPLVVSIAILGICAVILLLGKYALLDGSLKFILLILIISTVTAFFISLPQGFKIPFSTPSPSVWTLTGFSFMIALMGWMPAPIEVSVWTSLWSKQRQKQTQYTPSLKEALLDLRIGYVSSTLLAMVFLGLGAMVMFGSGTRFAESGVIFSEQLISMYTQMIGEWSHPIIAIAAFTTMFSTTMACMDAYPRAITAALGLAIPATNQYKSVLYWYFVLLLFFGSIIISGYFVRSIKGIIDLATIIAFLAAPIFAFMNYRLMTHPEILPDDKKPTKFMLNLSRVSMVLITFTGITFVIWYLFL